MKRLFFLLVLSACTPTPMEKVAEPILQARPIRVAILQDVSGSMTSSGTAQLQPEDLKPFLDHMSECGGEIALCGCQT